MFHVNAWGAAYTAFFAGTELIMPQMFLQGEPIVKMIQELRPTISLGVRPSGTTSFAPRRTTPTPISRAFAHRGRRRRRPRVMIEAFRDRFGINVIQGWG